MNIEKAYKVLEELADTLESLSIIFFLTHGTCLGIVRDKALIGGDRTLDIGVLYKDNDREILIEVLTKEGFRWAKNYPPKFLDRFIKDGVVVEISSQFYTEQKFCRKFEQFPYKDRNYNVPCPIRAYLERCFGRNWGKPAKGQARVFKRWNDMRVEKSGINLEVRDGSKDLNIIREVINRDEYGIGSTLTKDDIWLDIGAHIGVFSYLIAKRVKEVWAYEPEENNFVLLITNKALNSAKNVRCFDRAIVGDDSKEETLYLSSMTGTHSLLGNKGTLTEKVKCVNINEIIAVSKANKIKMDIEGAEYEVIKNADLRSIKELVMEYHHFRLDPEGDMIKFYELIDIFEKLFSVVEYDVNSDELSLIRCKK